MFDPSIPNFSPATFAVQEGGLRAIWSESSWRFRVSTIARSRPTATESRRWGSPYKAPAPPSGGAGRGNTHSRPSAACGGVIKSGPTAAGLAASVVSGRPTSGGEGWDTGAGAASTGAGRGRPPAGPRPGCVPPTGGSSTGAGAGGGTRLMNVRRSERRNVVVTASTTRPRCSARETSHGTRDPRGGTGHCLNSGEHLSQARGAFDEPRRRDRQGDPEEALAPRAEAASGHHADPRLLERAPLERGRGEPLGQGNPEIHRGTRRLGLEPLGAERGQHRVAPFLELRHLGPQVRGGIVQHGGTRRLHREKRPCVDVALDPRQRGDELRAAHGPAEPPPRHAEALRQGVELDRDLLRARDLEDAGRDVAVERDLAVRVVVGDDDVVPAAEGDRALQVIARRDRGGRIVGVVQV